MLVVGTYGLGFGEAGMLLDSGTLDDVDLRVPFVLRPAPSLGIAPRRFVNEMVSLVDVAPTLLELQGVVPPPGMQGMSLADLLHARQDARTRSMAFAAGGLHEGYRVWTEEFSYAWFVPAGNCDPALRSTWTGTELGGRSTPVRELLALPSRTALDLTDEANAREAEVLDAEAKEHFRWLAFARDAIHPAPWRDEEPGEGLLRELERRGLIAPRSE